MTWPTFAFAGAAIALWAWGGYWRDRAQRLAHERDVHRRMARRAQTAAAEGERRFRDPSRVITGKDYADLLDAMVERHDPELARRRARQRQADEVHAEATIGVGDPEAITRYMRDRYGDPDAWRSYSEGGVLPPGRRIVNTLGETVATTPVPDDPAGRLYEPGHGPSHRCDPPDMRRGESWTCPTCSITWGGPKGTAPGVPLDEAVRLIGEHGWPYDEGT